MKSPEANSFLALEIKDGLLYFLADSGQNAGTLRVLIAREKVNDRNPYKVILQSATAGAGGGVRIMFAYKYLLFT